MDTEQPYADAPAAEVEEEITELEGRLDDLRTRRANVEEELQGARSAVDEATEGVTAAPGEHDALDAATEHRARRDALSDALDRLDGQITDVEERLRTARQRLDSIEQAERLREVVEEGAEAHDEVRDALREALDAALSHLDAAADAHERLDRAQEAFNREAGATKEGRLDAAVTLDGDADPEAVALLLTSEEARAAGLPHVEASFPLKAEQTGHPADIPMLARAFRAGLRAILQERTG